MTGSRDNPALSAIGARVLALPPETALTTFTHAQALVPFLVEPPLPRGFASGAKLMQQLRAKQTFGVRMAALVIDFATDPDATTARFDAVLAEGEKHAREGEFLFDMPASYVRFLRPFAAIFREGDSLLADLGRQRERPPQPGPSSLVAIEDKVLALPPAVALETLRAALSGLEQRYRAGIKPYAEMLPTPELLRAAIAARQLPEFRVLAMIIAFANDPAGTLVDLKTVVTQCAVYQGDAPAYAYARGWAELLLVVRLPVAIPFASRVAKIAEDNRIDRGALEGLPELATDAQRREVALGLLDRIGESKGIDELAELCISRVGATVEAIPFFASFVNDVPTSSAGRAAMARLATIDDDRARAPLAGAAAATRSGHSINNPMEPMRAAVQLAIHDLDALRVAIGTCGPMVFHYIAGHAARTKPWKGKTKEWASFAASLLGEHPTEAAALLRLLPKERAAEAINRSVASRSTRGAAKTTHPSIPPKPRWLKRYEAGEHAKVWSEMVAAGPAGHAHPEAEAVARLTMERVRENITRLMVRFGEQGYQVKPLPAVPLPKLPVTLKAIEKIAGVPVPLSLEAFWEVVGAVDLRPLAKRKSDARWAPFIELDPLFVWEPAHTQRWLRANPPEKTAIASLREPVCFALGWSATDKIIGERTEDPMSIAVTDACADGMRYWAGSAPLPFVQFLRDTVACGGFSPRDGLQDEHRELAVLRDALRVPLLAF